MGFLTHYRMMTLDFTVKSSVDSSTGPVYDQLAPHVGLQWCLGAMLQWWRVPDVGPSSVIPHTLTHRPHYQHQHQHSSTPIQLYPHCAQYSSFCVYFAYHILKTCRKSHHIIICSISSTIRIILHSFLNLKEIIVQKFWSDKNFDKAETQIKFKPKYKLLSLKSLDLRLVTKWNHLGSGQIYYALPYLCGRGDLLWPKIDLCKRTGFMHDPALPRC